MVDPPNDYSTPPSNHEIMWFMSAVVVGLARIYDVMLLQLSLDHGDDVAMQMLEGHSKGEYLFPYEGVKEDDEQQE